jgi:hypothetical protein
MARPPNYRESDQWDPYRTCLMCAAYNPQNGGQCRKYKASVFPNYVCDAFEIK